MNFSHQNLQGRSFKKSNLTDSDFSYADIRGVNFEDATLTKANFSNVIAGQPNKWILGLTIMLLIFIVLAGLLMGVCCAAIGLLSFDDIQNYPFNILSGLLILFSLVIFAIIISRQGFGQELGVSAVTYLILSILFQKIAKENEAGTVLLQTFFLFGIVALNIAISILKVSTSIISKRFFSLISGTVIIISIVISEILTILNASKPDPNSPSSQSWILPPTWRLPFYLFMIVITLIVWGSSVYISWKAIKEDSKYNFIHSPALTLASLGATSFRDSDLTDADFTNANLKYTDFRNANLTRTCWLNARQLDLARINQTYLENSDIRKLVVDKYAEKVKFDNIKCDLNLENATLKEVNLREANLDAANLKGVTCIDVNFDEANLHNANLESAKLQGASLMGADLSQANLKNADLSGAKLVRTQLYEADLTGANLTGAFIQDWGISDKTKLDQIKCEEIFMQLPIKENKYDPCRKPDETDEYFQEGDFIDFITPLRDTLKDYHQKYFDPRQEVRILDLPHRGGIDSLAAAIALKELTERYPKAGIEVVALQGGRDKIIILQIKVNKEVNRSQISTEYKEKYREIVSLPNQERQSFVTNLTKGTNECIRSLGNIIDTVMTSKQIYLETDINFLGKKKILFLAANPQHQDEHRLQVEIREIQKGLERAKRREQFEIIPKWAVSLDDLRYYLLNENPQIIHFSGYGVAEEGLAFESKDGQTQFANPLALAKLFELFKDKLECVFLNACYSEPQAKAISQHIDYVIAINQQMSDPAAIKFAVGFYDALGAGRFIEDAFKFGCIALNLDNLPESSKPVIITKNGDYSC